MLPAFVIALREGLEAALIVAILAAYLKKTGRAHDIRKLWYGVATAIAASLALGILVSVGTSALTKRNQELIEGVAGFIAVAVLTWMIFWMRKQSMHIKADLEGKLEIAVSSGATFALAFLAFTAVAREGLETVLFLYATFTASDSALRSAAAATSGLLFAAGLGYAIYRGGSRLNIRLFFQVTGGLIIFVAAGVLSASIHALNEARLLMFLHERAWDMSGFANPSAGGAEGVLGSLAKGLIGYEPRPTVLQVIAYWGYLLPVLFAFYAIPAIRARRADVAPDAGDGWTDSTTGESPAEKAEKFEELSTRKLTEVTT